MFKINNFNEFLSYIKTNIVGYNKINFDKIKNLDLQYTINKNIELYKSIYKNNKDLVLGLPKTSTSSYLSSNKYMTWHDSIIYPDIEYNTFDDTQWDEKCLISLYIIYKIRSIDFNKYNFIVTFRDPVALELSNYFYFKYNNGKQRYVSKEDIIKDLTYLETTDFINNIKNRLKNWFELVYYIWGIDVTKKYKNVKYINSDNNKLKIVNNNTNFLYNLIKNNYKLHKETLDEIYDNTIYQIVFSQEEILKYKNRWCM